MSDCLHRVSMEQYAVLFTDIAYLSNRLNCSDFIIRRHNRYKAGVLTDCLFKLA
jgi:hypothetical protein